MSSIQTAVVYNIFYEVKTKQKTSELLMKSIINWVDAIQMCQSITESISLLGAEMQLFCTILKFSILLKLTIRIKFAFFAIHKFLFFFSLNDFLLLFIDTKNNSAKAHFICFFYD